MLGVDSEARTLGVEVSDVRNLQVGGIRVRCSDLTFRLDATIDLERLITATPARWAVSSLAEDPDDGARRERAVAAVRAAGKGLSEGTTRFDLAVVRLDGGGILGGVILLFGQGTNPGDRLAYVLTPDMGLADLLAADRGRLATEFADGLSPSAGEGEWAVHARELLVRFEPLMKSPGMAVSGGLAIVRAEPTPALAGRHPQPRPGVGRRAGQLLGKALGRLGPAY